MEKKKYVVQLADNSIHVINTTQKPMGPSYTKVLDLPLDMYSEDERWLQIELVDLVDTVTINQAEKTTQQDLDNQAAIDKAAADAEEAKVSKMMSRLDFGRRLRAEIAVLNVEKGWTTAQVQAYMSNRVVQSIDALLNAGALNSALDAITFNSLDAFYTAAEKQTFIDKINGYIANE